MTNMKKIITTIVILIMTASYGQSSYKKADKYFDKLWYKEAAGLYEAALDKGDLSKELLEKAGDANYFNTNMAGACKWYDKLVSNYYSEVNPEYILRYSIALEGTGKYLEAKRWMKEFSKRTKSKDDRSPNFNQKDQTVDDVLSIPAGYLLKNLSINTKNSDFGPMYYNNQLVYSSADSTTFHTRVYKWNDQPYLDMFIGEMNELESDVTHLKEFSKELNTRYHEATLAFSPDEKKVYFTRNNYQGKLERDGEGTNHLKLYSAEIVKEKDSISNWSNIKELPFNSEDYSVGHPTVSTDGKLLYFVSDMPGSIGATDIFVVDVKENDEYSEPRNLGNNINTSGREMFPFITDNTLYLASDGHLGIGGLDVFQSKIKDSVFQEVKNLGAPLNSKLDDFGFIISKDNQKGFVCSNRTTGKGDDDIYSFVRIETEEDCMQEVAGVVKNKKTGELIPQATVTLVDVSSKVIERVLVGNDAAFKFSIDCDSEYKVIAEKIDYSSDSKVFVTPKTDLKLNLDLGLDLGLDLSLEPSRTLDPMPSISNVAIGDDVRFILGIEIIYFDFDKDFIRSPDATADLHKVIALMKYYPSVHIDVKSHTDSRATDAYNDELSARRNKATIDYIVNIGGIDRSRLTGKGYGERELANRCSDGVKCTEAEHDLNRRSEFILIKK